MIRGLLLLYFACLTLCSSAQNYPIVPAKIPSSLQMKLMTFAPGDSVTVSIALSVNKSDLIRKLSLKTQYSSTNIFIKKLSFKDIRELASNADVLFINEWIQPKEELNTGAV